MYIKLPAHIPEIAIKNLIDALAGSMGNEAWMDNQLKPYLDSCNLQPTSRAALLAAEAAVCVLLAHEIGQEVGR